MTRSQDNEFPHLKNAPIKEAAIQVNVQPPLSGKQLSRFKEFIEKEYPQTERMKEVAFGMPPNGGLPQPLERDAYRHWSGDRQYAVMFMSDMLAITRLRPYTNSKDFYGRFLELWDNFIGETEIDDVMIAIRYINEFTMSSDEAERHLKVGLQMHYGKLPMAMHTVDGRFDANILESEACGLVVAMTTFRIAGQPDDKLYVLLDNEIRFAKPKVYEGKETIKDALAEMAVVKNTLFFSNIEDAKGYFG